MHLSRDIVAAAHEMARGTLTFRDYYYRSEQTGAGVGALMLLLLSSMSLADPSEMVTLTRCGELTTAQLLCGRLVHHAR